MGLNPPVPGIGEHSLYTPHSRIQISVTDGGFPLCAWDTKLPKSPLHRADK